MRRLLSSCALALALVGPSHASADGAPPAPTGSVGLAATKTRLPNGLEVILHEDHRTPIVTVNLWYHVGSKDEPPHRNGFAHLFEHVMFQGSKHVPEDTYFRYLEQAGATAINGTTNSDRTNYFETVPKNRLELALWLESDRMGFLLDHADEATFKSQREVVKNERRQNYENAPYGLVSEVIRAEVFPAGHPYHLLTIGTPEDLDRATLDDVRAFFRQWYVPNNATIVIAGDIEPARTQALVEKYFGPIPRGPEPKRAPAPEVKLTGETRIEMEADVELPRVYLSWPSPKFFAPGDGELDLVGRALSSGKTSRLYKRLVYDDQTAQSVSAGQASMELVSMFQIAATVKPGKTTTEVLAAIDDEIAKLQSGGVEAAELSRAQTSMLSEMVFGLERSSSRGNQLNMYNHYVHSPQYFERDMARVKNATAAAVQGAAKTWLPKDKRVVTIVTPSKSAPIAGRVTKITRPGAGR
ncbi:MAG: pitrilysin family protein [Polyangiaceae bacterium]